MSEAVMELHVSSTHSDASRPQTYTAYRSHTADHASVKSTSLEYK